MGLSGQPLKNKAHGAVQTDPFIHRLFEATFGLVDFQNGEKEGGVEALLVELG
jgi:hypothetical protein